MIVPGIGLPRPANWKNSSGEWLKVVQKPHGEKVRIWHYDYEAVKGQPVLQSLLQQSHVLPAVLHRLNPRSVGTHQCEVRAVTKMKSHLVGPC